MNTNEENSESLNYEKHLPKNLLDSPDNSGDYDVQEEDDYFKCSDNEEESKEEQIKSNSKNSKINSNILSLNNTNNNINFGNNNHIPSNFENSTKDDSNYYSIGSQMNSIGCNIQNQKIYVDNNLSMINNNQFNINNNNHINSYNQNFSHSFNNINPSKQNLLFNSFGNNMNSSHNNYSSHSFNFNMNSQSHNYLINSLGENGSMGNPVSPILLPQGCNSFGGLSSINPDIPILSLNIDNYKSQSFNNNNIKNRKNLNKCKIFNYESKYSLDDVNPNVQSKFNLKKLTDMSEQSLYDYIITQKGSRDVQAFIEKKSKEKEIYILINKLRNYISDISIKKYGNYFIQELIKICSPSQRIILLEFMKNRFLEISKNTYGTFCLQALIEISSLPKEKQLILSCILGNEKELSLDARGTHILQKFIKCTKDEERFELNANIINLIDCLITDASGVYVLNALVDNTNDKSIKLKLFDYITKNGPLYFIQHEYANYAVLSLIKSSDLSDYEPIVKIIVENSLPLSMIKYSSNIVEYCLSCGSKEVVLKIYESLIVEHKLESLLNNTYGNYVLEKLIERVDKGEKLVLKQKLEKLVKNKSNVSKNIMNLLNK